MEVCVNCGKQRRHLTQRKECHRCQKLLRPMRLWLQWRRSYRKIRQVNDYEDLSLIELCRVVGLYLSPPSTLDPTRGWFIR